MKEQKDREKKSEKDKEKEKDKPEDKKDEDKETIEKEKDAKVTLFDAVVEATTADQFERSKLSVMEILHL